MNPVSVECASDEMLRRLPGLFVSFVGVLLCSAILGVVLLGHEVFAQEPERHVEVLDEHALKLILHRNAASTVWPQVLPVVHDKQKILLPSGEY